MGSEYGEFEKKGNKRTWYRKRKTRRYWRERVCTYICMYVRVNERVGDLTEREERGNVDATRKERRQMNPGACGRRANHPCAPSGVVNEARG